MSPWGKDCCWSWQLSQVERGLLSFREQKHLARDPQLVALSGRGWAHSWAWPLGWEVALEMHGFLPGSDAHRWAVVGFAGR